MNIFFIGLILNMISGIFNIPIGPERYIKRLYKTAYAVIDSDYEGAARVIADIIVFTAANIFVFMIVWVLSDIYALIPIPFFREIISGMLFCLTLRMGQGDNLHLIYMIRHGRRGGAVKRLYSEEKKNPSDEELCAVLMRRKDYTVRLIACPVFYMCFGLIPAFIYKTIEIISRTQNNSAALVAYKVTSFIPAILFRAAVRISGLLLKRRVISGGSVHALIESYTGHNRKEGFTFGDVIKTEALIYLSAAIFSAFMLAASYAIKFIWFY